MATAGLAAQGFVMEPSAGKEPSQSADAVLPHND